MNPTVILHKKKLEVDFYGVCDPIKTRLIVSLKIDNLEGAFVKIAQIKRNGDVRQNMCCKAFMPYNVKCEGFLTQIIDTVNGKLTIKRIDGGNEETLDVKIIRD
ncbi:Hypothetical_protein [Hexamita inflata]|uniref:Hypothetical_protein n=1 Tax=Hexamita inflata TaxID=28002 RepID=A0AA86QPK2_9EUKA|nr:Hypothetical protein HINF_LOCUS51111 [Hexamita inflata]